MSLETMKQVAEVEEQMRQRIAAARAHMKSVISSTEAASKLEIERKQRAAEKKVERMIAEAEARAAQRAEISQQRLQLACEQLRADALPKINEAVSLILGRVVNG